jgi:hypothetical protein
LKQIPFPKLTVLTLDEFNETLLGQWSFNIVVE